MIYAIADNFENMLNKISEKQNKEKIENIIVNNDDNEKHNYSVDSVGEHIVGTFGGFDILFKNGRFGKPCVKASIIILAEPPRRVPISTIAPGVSPTSATALARISYSCESVPKTSSVEKRIIAILYSHKNFNYASSVDQKDKNLNCN